jgi:two-component sensor histidine kinase
MCPPSNADRPVVETTPGEDGPDVTLRALKTRIRQQEVLAELGVMALQGASFEKLLKETAKLTAQGLGAEFCKVLEHIPTENRLLVRAGTGWEPGIVGKATIGADIESPAGFALRTGKPVISNHLENEERFRTPEILRQHGIHRAMNVILQGDGRPFGVLEVDSRSEDEFAEQDLAFLQGAANILGMAIERERHERNLEAGLERERVLRNEMNHRVKNSLMIVSSMLQLQARDIEDPTATAHVEEAAHRVAAVARAHDHLFQGTDIEKLDLGKYIEGVCKDLDASVPRCVIHMDAEADIELPTDRAISVALIVNELITNAAKYAYPGRSDGKIHIALKAVADDRLLVSVRDEGAGLPPGFDLAKPKGLGMRIIASFAHQLGGTLDIHARDPGTEFVLTIPRKPPQQA